jgi:hypothetical protein
VPSNRAEPAHRPDAIDPQTLAAVRQTLQTLQSDRAIVDQQLSALKGFSKGEQSGSSGTQSNARQYDWSSVEEQIRRLEDKKARLPGAIDDRLDAARAAGIEPGHLAESILRGNVTRALPPAYFATQEFACVEPSGIAVQDCGILGITANAIAVRQKSEGVSAMRELARAAIVSKRFSGALFIPHPVCLALSL